jgi:hypothetical protein
MHFGSLVPSQCNVSVSIAASQRAGTTVETDERAGSFQRNRIRAGFAKKKGRCGAPRESVLLAIFIIQK